MMYRRLSRPESPESVGARIAEEALAAIRTALARVVAGRPDQPARTTPIAEGTVKEALARLFHLRRQEVMTGADHGRVTVHATDPHTPDE